MISREVLRVCFGGKPRSRGFTLGRVPEEVKCFSQTKVYQKALPARNSLFFLSKLLEILSHQWYACTLPLSWLIHLGVFLYLTFIFPKSLYGIPIYHQPQSLVQSSSEQSPDLCPGHVLHVSGCGKRSLTFTSFWGDELLLCFLMFQMLFIEGKVEETFTFASS